MRHPQHQNKPAGWLKRHHIALGTLCLGIILVVTGVTTSDQVEANRHSQPIAIGLQAEEPFIDASPEAGVDVDITTAAAATESIPPVIDNRWREETVRSGDSLSRIFSRVGLSGAALHEILNTEIEAKALRQIYPGQSLAFDIDDEGVLQGLRYTKSPLEATVFSRTESGFDVTDELRSPEMVQTYRASVLDNSLFLDGKAAGISVQTIMEFAGIFGGVIDFALDPRQGDTFSILYEEKFLDGDRLGDGDIIAAEYVNRGKRFTAYRFKDHEGDTGYFSADGVSMRKAFLRAPLDFTRVSSNFNLKRLHPVAKVVRPHRGVDYAASTGTPVYAAGDGKVKASGYSRANGNYVFITHPNNIETHYLHLHKRSVKRGARVKQGEIIGSVGSTGLATGPHLHYEFLLDGVHRNPRTIIDKLPRAKTLATADMARFARTVTKVELELAKLDEGRALALQTPSENE